MLQYSFNNQDFAFTYSSASAGYSQGLTMEFQQCFARDSKESGGLHQWLGCFLQAVKAIWASSLWRGAHNKLYSHKPL